MEITNKILHSLEKDIRSGFYNSSSDEQNDIINIDYKGEEYRIIVEKIE